MTANEQPNDYRCGICNANDEQCIYCAVAQRLDKAAAVGELAPDAYALWLQLNGFGPMRRVSVEEALAEWPHKVGDEVIPWPEVSP